jgi:hypothetical protein
MFTKRLEVLLEPAVFGHLQEKARDEGQTIGGYVRKLLDECLIAPPVRQKQAALQRLFSSDLEIDIGDWKEEKAALSQQRARAFETH